VDATDERLLSRLQRDFPLTERPYLALGQELGLSEQEIIRRVQGLKEAGLIRSISAVFEPARLGLKSALVAAEVEAGRLEEAAGIASSFPEVTHNYAREDTFNLWFTVIAASEERLHEIVRLVEGCAGVRQVAVLPALRKFKLQVQFDFNSGALE